MKKLLNIISKELKAIVYGFVGILIVIGAIAISTGLLSLIQLVFDTSMGVATTYYIGFLCFCAAVGSVMIFISEPDVELPDRRTKPTFTRDEVQKMCFEAYAHGKMSRRDADSSTFNNWWNENYAEVKVIPITHAKSPEL